MHDGDKREFRDLLADVAAYYDRRLEPTTMAIYWRGLADLPLDAVKAALSAHVQDAQAGQFMPKIADIRRAIEDNREDGHPGADEAWSIALPARHESASVVWTEQISAAFFAAALPLLDEGDKIAARRSFIERYEREVAHARKDGIPARWVVSPGGDPAARTIAIERAVEEGRLTHDYAQRLLPGPVEQISQQAVAAIENGMRERSEVNPEARKHIEKLRAMLGMRR